MTYLTLKNISSSQKFIRALLIVLGSIGMLGRLLESDLWNSFLRIIFGGNYIGIDFLVASCFYSIGIMFYFSISKIKYAELLHIILALFIVSQIVFIHLDFARNIFSAIIGHTHPTNGVEDIKFVYPPLCSVLTFTFFGFIEILKFIIDNQRKISLLNFISGVTIFIFGVISFILLFYGCKDTPCSEKGGVSIVAGIGFLSIGIYNILNYFKYHLLKTEDIKNA